MELNYKTYTEVYEKDGCLHVVDGKEKIDDLMITYWIPLNFKCKTHNFLLRNNHISREMMIDRRNSQIQKLWLEELNIDPTKYYLKKTNETTKDDITYVDNSLEYIKKDVSSFGIDEEYWKLNDHKKIKTVEQL